MEIDKIKLQKLDSGSRWAYDYIKTELSELKLYLGTMDDFIKKSYNEDISKLQKKFDDLSEHAKEEFLLVNYPIHWEEIFEFNLRSSFILLIFTTIEPFLNYICKSVEIVSVSKIKFNDLKGGLYQRAQKYLETFGQFQRPNNKLWEAVIDIYTLRNAIAHNGRAIEGSNGEKRIDALMKKAPGLSIPSAGMLRIKHDFCEYSLSIVEKFIDELYESSETSMINNGLTD